MTNIEITKYGHVWQHKRGGGRLTADPQGDITTQKWIPVTTETNPECILQTTCSQFTISIKLELSVGQQLCVA